MERVAIDHDWQCEACGSLDYCDFNNSELLREMTLMIHSFAQGHWATHAKKYNEILPAGHRLETASPHLNTDGTLRLTVQLKNDGGIETREYPLWPHAPRMANEVGSCYDRMAEIIQANYLLTGVFAAISPEVVDLFSPDTREVLADSLRSYPARSDVASIVQTVITTPVLLALRTSKPEHARVRAELIRLLAHSSLVSHHHEDAETATASNNSRRGKTFR